MNNNYIREDIVDALNRIESMLEDDYIDLNGWPDEIELYIVEEAIKEYRTSHGY